MTHTVCLVSLVSTVSGCCKNALGKGSASKLYITNLKVRLHRRDLARDFALACMFSKENK